MLTFFLLVFIGALIGGFTNYVAIIMLFRPYEPWHIGAFQLPFTPGLIPKRRREIARQLGRIVEEYLMTESAIREAMLTPRMERELAIRMRLTLRRFLKGKASAVQLGEELAIPRWREWMEGWSSADLEENSLTRFLANRIKPVYLLPLHSWLPLSPEARKEVSQFLTQEVSGQLQEFLRSHRGRRWATEVISLMIAKRNPVWQWAAAVFVREERVNDLLLEPLLRYFNQPEVQAEWAEKLEGNIGEWMEKSLAELTRTSTPEEVAKKVISSFGIREKITAFLHRPVVEWGKDLYFILLPLLPRVSAWILKQLNEELGGIYRTLRISHLVEKEVASFPLRKLEQMILEVARKELTAITWLGALLGGIIGAVQYLLVRG